MSSQEELVRCLQQLTEAIAKNHSHWFSFVRDDNRRVACQQEHPVKRSWLRKSNESDEPLRNP